ncbi:FtsK/SpoIIIE family DNA translocase [Sinanaerobacter chloroacetimidivorans]|nr:DNA translocase FtsK [Sinanaerobacter chloroacetimidivorans]
MEQKRKPGRPPGSKNKTKKNQTQTVKNTGGRLEDEIWAIVIIALGIFLVVSLQTEAAGKFGVAISILLKGSFGMVAYILPYYLILYGILLFTKRTAHISGRSIAFLFLIFLMMTLLNSARYFDADSNYSFSFQFIADMFQQGSELKTGGAFGMVFGFLLIKTIGMTGLYILSTVVIIISLMLVINTPVSQFFDALKAKRELKKRERMMIAEESDFVEEEPETNIKEETAAQGKKKKKADEKEDHHKIVSSVDASMFPVPPQPEPAPVKTELPITNLMSENQMKILDYMNDDELFEKSNAAKIGMGLEEAAPAEPGLGLDGELKKVPDTTEKIPEKVKIPELIVSPEEVSKGAGVVSKPYHIPPIDLLSKSSSQNSAGESESLKAKAAKLEQTLHDFNVNAKVIQVTRGPAVTRYEIQPNTGVKVSSIVRLADDIALNLEAKSIRMEAPIPGKAAVGIEVENERVNLVSIREIIESAEFKSAKSKLSFAVGKDIAGKSIVADLKSMPHMLIAGSTGSGKSVCINSIIISLLYKAKPDEVKFVLIDPKVVELGNYNGIPHLLIPVVTEPGKAAAALNWAVAEMTDRYKKFAEEGVRDLESFNNSIKRKGEEERFLPQIVIIIDELADLMMAAPSQVEESICRLAQMARAAGMHLIVATQRPSVDIITGVIKANIPSRIAFAVSSQFDSRTILDMAGAEKLVGKGDMLFNPIGMAKPVRVQGTFISDTEVHKVIEFVKGQAPETEYASEVIHTIEKVQAGPGEENTDELLSDAIETVVRAKQASVSMLQRRFRIGYNRAARLIDMMEAREIIGPADGSRPRSVLMTEDEFLGLAGVNEEE